MDLLSLLTVVIVVGVALYLVQLVPMDPTIKRILSVIVIAFLVIWALRVLLGGGPVLQLR